jgi:SAM-dependent methyltransferase
MQTDRANASVDYRTSHLERGVDYDNAIEAAPFDAYMARIERELLREIVPRLFPANVPRYLDFACGTGRITQTIAPLAEVSVGVDISASMLARAQERCPGTEFFEHDLTRASLNLEPVDLVSSFRFLGNAQPELRTAALRAIHGLLAPEGYLIVNNHRNPWSIHNLLLRLRRRADGADLTLHALVEAMQDAGFRIVAVYGIGLWVLRHTLHRPAILESSWARRFEPVSRLPGLGRFCPDVIVVAQRV